MFDTTHERDMNTTWNKRVRIDWIDTYQSYTLNLKVNKSDQPTQITT